MSRSLIATLVVFSSLTSQLALAGSPKSRSAQVRSPQNAAPELKPRSIDLRITPELAQTAVKNALAAFNKSGDLKELGKALTEIEKSGKAETDISMRGMRKPAKALRNLLVWVDEHHNSDAVKGLPFAQFVGALGRLNVALTAGVEAHIAPAAQSARAAFERMNVERDLGGFTPTTAPSFQQFLGTQLATADRLMAQSDMTMGEFHDVRKVMRGLFFTVHYSGVDEKSAKAKRFAKVLERIGHDMGQIHDAQEQQSLKGEIGALDQLRFEMPQALRSDIEMLLASVNR